MAIDTQVKRMGASSIKPFHRMNLPDGDIGVEDRHYIAGTYYFAAVLVVPLKFRHFRQEDYFPLRPALQVEFIPLEPEITFR